MNRGGRERPEERFVLPECMQDRREQRGFSYIEMLVVAAVLIILASALIPMSRWDEKRRREDRLRITLRQMSAAIDQYKAYVDSGLLIQTDVEQMGYPLELEELVEGVEIGDPLSISFKTVKFLQRLPIDPMTGEADWGLRSYQDDWDSDSWGGENIYDIYSVSSVRALDGTYYRDW